MGGVGDVGSVGLRVSRVKLSREWRGFIKFWRGCVGPYNLGVGGAGDIGP